MYRTSVSSVEERRLLEIAQDHVRIVLGAVRELGQAVDLWLIDDEQVLEKTNNLIELENEADIVKRSFLQELSKAIPSILHKEELLRLVLTVDKIADKAEGAGFFLTTLIGWFPPKDLEMKIRDFCNESFECAEKLRKAMLTVVGSPLEAMKIIEEIDKGENKTDNLFRELTVFTYSVNQDPFLAMKLKDFFLRIEEIADISNEAADTVRMISLARIG